MIPTRKWESKCKHKGDTIKRITLFLSSALTLECPSLILRRSLILWLKDYARGKWNLFPLSPPRTPFSQKAASFLQRVPLGKVISYQEIALAIGHPNAARAIGNFCRGNLFPLLIPCHRVLPQSGGLGNFTPDPQIKRQLLLFEGIAIS